MVRTAPWAPPILGPFSTFGEILHSVFWACTTSAVASHAGV